MENENREQMIAAGAAHDPEARLAGIRLYNEERVAAGLKPLTEQQMTAYANDRTSAEEYRLCAETAEKLLKSQNASPDLPYAVPRCLDRSKGYVFNLADTDEARRENRELEAKLATREGKREFVRGVYDYLMNTDESTVFAKNIGEKTAYFQNDTQFKQMLFEAKYIIDNADDDIFTKEELARAEQKYSVFYHANGYEPTIRSVGSPYYLTMPEMGMEDMMLLRDHYFKTNQTDKVEYMNMRMAAYQDLEIDKYLAFAADALKERGFLDAAGPEVSYQAFDDKGRPVKNKITAMRGLSEGTMKSAEFVRITKGADGAETREKCTLTRDRIVKDYNRYHVNKLLAEAYPGRETPVFSDDPKKDLAGKAVLLYRLKTPYFKAIRDDAQKEARYREIVEDIASGRDDMTAYLSRLKPEFADGLISDIFSPNAKDTEIANGFATDSRIENDSIAAADGLGEAYFKGMFAPKTDPSGMRFLFGDSKTHFEPIDETQKQADAIVLDVPEGLTADDVSAVVMSCLLTDANMAESYNKAKNMNGSTMKDWNPADAGYGNFVQNTLGGDPRPNMHLPRLMLPEARAEAGELLKEYADGQYDAIAEKASACFKNMLATYRGFADPSTVISMSNGRIVTALYDLLEKPGFRERVNISGEDRTAVESIRMSLRLAREERALHAGIVEKIQQKILTNRYAEGAEKASAGYVKGEDPELDDMLREYKTRKMFFDRVTDSRTNYRTAVSEMFGISGEEHVKAMSGQPLCRAQKNMTEDPEAYLAFLREEADKNGKLEEKLSASWNTGLLQFKLSENLNPPHTVDNIAYSEQWRLGGEVRNALALIPKAERRPALEKIVSGLPFTKETDLSLELTTEEMTRRAEAYEKAAEAIRRLPEITVQQPNPNFDEEDDDESERYFTVSVTQKLTKALSNEAELLRGALPAALSEKAYERAAAERKAAYVNNADFTEIEQRAEEARTAADNEAAQYGEEPFNHASKTTYRRMIGDLAGKAATVSDRELRDVMNRVAFSVGRPSEDTVLREAAEQLDEIQERLGRRILDSNDPQLAEEFGIAVNLTNRIEAFREAGELRPEAADKNSPYAVAYEKAKDFSDRIERIMTGPRAEQIRTETPEYWKLLQLAKGSAENIRNAVAEEAFGNVEKGIATLKESDDIATMTVFSVISSTKSGSAIREMLENSGVGEFILSADRSPEIRGKKTDLTINKIAEAVSFRNGFAEMISDEEKRPALRNAPERAKTASKEEKLREPPMRMSK